MATNASIQETLSFDGTNCFGIAAKDVQAAELLRIKAWFEANFEAELESVGRADNANAQDFGALLWRTLRGRVRSWEREQNIANTPAIEPAELSA